MRAARGRDVLLIAVTGYGDESSRSQAREAGFDEHLVKPIQHAEFTSVLARVRAARPQHADRQNDQQDHLR
ncbi:MAG: hypothetical protein U1E76_25350 [Planctomycetota bacterium]